MKQIHLQIIITILVVVGMYLVIISIIAIDGVYQKHQKGYVDFTVVIHFLIFSVIQCFSFFIIAYCLYRKRERLSLKINKKYYVIIGIFVIIFLLVAVVYPTINYKMWGGNEWQYFPRDMGGNYTVVCDEWLWQPPQNCRDVLLEP